MNTKMTRKEFLKLCLKLPVIAGIGFGLFKLTAKIGGVDKSSHICRDTSTVCRNCKLLTDCKHPTAQSFTNGKTE